MSYILDALKKSQQQRDLDSIPTLTDTPPVRVAGSSRKNLPVIGALMLAMLAVLLALYAVLTDRFVEPHDPLKISEQATPDVDAKLPEAPVSAIRAETPALVSLPTIGESKEADEEYLQAQSVSSPVNKPEKPTSTLAAASEKLMPTDTESEAERASTGAGKAEISSRQLQPGKTDLSNQQTTSIPSVPKPAHPPLTSGRFLRTAFASDCGLGSMLSAFPKVASSGLAAGADAGLELSGPLLDGLSNCGADTKGSGADAASFTVGSHMAVASIRLAVRGGCAGFGTEGPEGIDGVC